MENNNTELTVKNKASHPTYGVISSNPKPIGGYDITGSKTIAGSIRFMFPKKPNWFHRMCCRFFLGWKWVDEEETQSLNETIQVQDEEGTLIMPI